MKKVVIIGMGFGGIRAVHGLAHTDFDVLVIDRRNFHLFQPLLYQVATAMLDQEAIAHSIRAIVRRWRNVRFQLDEVQRVDLANKTVIAAHKTYPYDYLIVAAGSVTNFFGIPSIEQHARDLKQLNHAVSLRNHLLSMFERASLETDPEKRKALMTFAIVGGGPTGVEFAGALSELVHHVLVKDYPELPVHQSRIILLEASPHVLGPFPEKLQRYACRRLEKMGVEIHLNTAVSDAAEDCVRLKDGTQIPSYTLFWAAGVKAASVAEGIEVEKKKGGRIPVQPDLTLQDHPEVFVIGDLMHLEQDGQPLPMVAPVAMQGGEYAARAIRKRERGETPKPFRYFDKGSMAVIGRNAAVASSFGISMKGFIAWLAWLALHLFYLIGFRNRLLTLINWGFDYLLFDRQVRLITREADPRVDPTSKPV